MSSTAPRGRERKLPATFYRGGTSKALLIKREDLPPHGPKRDSILLSAMGSPDPNGRQLDGMGGGYSSVSKVAIVGVSAHDGADVDYEFAQVLVEKPGVDYGSNCGNMLAAVGPFALENGLVSPHDEDGLNLVRIYNTNTRKVIHARFPIFPGSREADLDGDYAIDGVSGTHARITLDFLAPEGSRTGRLLPTSNVVDTLSIPEEVTVSLMDCGNPCVFVRASDMGIKPTILPSEFTASMLARLDALRNAAAVKMGLVQNLEEAAAKKAVPKVCIVSPKQTHTVLSGATVSEEMVDVVVRCISSGDPHRALPITASLCTAAAAHVPGTVVHDVLNGDRVADGIAIGHASGTIAVDADVVTGEDGELHVPTARVFRTARKLFEGNVFYRE
ncbi:hypothetical protein CcaverHIS002_0604740 [Cutaneotrichosporon cavernicola]|uniref:PrpF protein n=1 Tax=Cutaneotrichosporon cavernicola TaxID=279322 RepID=A0AA48QXV4_9TREE|nr:uncharacterized protein CcaverHIS019_0604180 [Cutaneotrichosporon cavernicola]BEI86187.1 hypothetical protein CcaverHIS002_0604740 [Cutaneotrichosporon cavernicola]BEI93959.1 hypothetical protein CcaverHIS019_0604180 [Cutaneotrichosporon cavernicola]BEJ01740.1 hypothetical protein CcaverHIS631_0604220 [Cutaneotrichosporon cavernicola]